MLRLLNRYLHVLLCAFFIISCDSINQFIDEFNIYDYVNLRPIRILTEPEINDSVLPDFFSPVIIKFDTEMKKHDVEGILQINSNLGIMSGEKTWSGNDLYFIPETGWTAGIRYNLYLAGTIRSVDGRETRIEQYL